MMLLPILMSLGQRAPSPHGGEGWGEGVTAVSIDPNPSPYGRGSRPDSRLGADSKFGGRAC
jgi:hypothetical protein